MGIYDRHYIRDDAPRGRSMAGVRSRMGMWSVTTWLIVLCVAVFVIDGMMPKSTWKLAQVRTIGIPTMLHIESNPRYKYVPIQNPTLPPGYREANVVDTATGSVVGTSLHELMSPLKRWLFFSTGRTFLRPLQVFEFWRFIGFQFLHQNLSHILFNMLGLFFFGPMVEQYLGRKRFLAFYLLCGVCGALLYLLLNLGGFVVGEVLSKDIRIPGLLFNSPYTPLVGASAGVFGVLMAGAFLAPNTKVLVFFILPMRLRTVAYALIVFALFTVFTEGGNAGGEAGHLGGAIAGFYFIRRPHRLHGFFDIIGRADPTSHHYRGRRGSGAAPDRTEVDRILDKINRKGLRSLTAKEKKILRESSRE